MILPLLFAIHKNPAQVFGQLCLTEPLNILASLCTILMDLMFILTGFIVSYTHVDKYFVTQSRHLYHGVPAPQDVGACADCVSDWLKLGWESGAAWNLMNFEGLPIFGEEFVALGPQSALMVVLMEL